MLILPNRLDPVISIFVQVTQEGKSQVISVFKIGKQFDWAGIGILIR